jgi:hypothetical protein
MKTKKLLGKVTQYLNLGSNSQAAMRVEMKGILKKLKKKEWNIRDKIVTEDNDLKRKRFQREVDVIHAQRTKGLRAYKDRRDNQPE